MVEPEAPGCLEILLLTVLGWLFVMLGAGASPGAEEIFRLF